MGVTEYPPASGPGGPASVLAFTQSLTGLAGPSALTAVDPNGVNTSSFLAINTSLLSSSTGVIFSAGVVSTGDRFRFEARHVGTNWQPTAALSMVSGYWDYEHRTYDPGGLYAWAVPALGAGDLRIVRVAGTPGVNTCTAGANAHHGAFPSPPLYVGKRDVQLMIKAWGVPGSLTLAPFDVMQENDDRTRTWTVNQPNQSRPVRTGRRFWVQGYDAMYLPFNSTDRAKVQLLSKVNGAVSVLSDPKLEIMLASTTGRAITLPQPMEFQAALGAGQMHVGIAAQGFPGLGALTMTVFGFETL